MSARYLTAVFACVLPAFGCSGGSGDSSGHSVVGIWDFSVPRAKGATYLFSSDGTLKEVVITTNEDQHGTRTMTLGGTYKIDGNKVTINLQSAAIDTDESSNKQLVSAAAQRLQAAMKATPTSTGEIAWKDNDHWTLTLTTPGYGGGPGSTQTINMSRHS